MREERRAWRDGDEQNQPMKHWPSRSTRIGSRRPYIRTQYMYTPCVTHMICEISSACTRW